MSDTITSGGRVFSNPLTVKRTRVSTMPTSCAVCSDVFYGFGT
jgi:hypothetical protein